MTGVPTAESAPTCPKNMTFGPCGGVRPDLACEMAAHPCVFIDDAPIAWPGGERSGPPVQSSLLDAAANRPVIITDLTLPPFDAGAVAAITTLLSDSCDAVLVGEHQNRPDFPPTLMAQLIRNSGGVPWLTLTCRDRNRLVLEQDLAGLGLAGADGVLCVTGDGRATGVRPGVTQVFDLDGTRLAALAAEHGLPVAVPESPAAEPRAVRAQRLREKERAGANLAILNHLSRPADVDAFVAAARRAGVTLPLIPGVAIYTDARSAAVLQNFPGFQLDGDTVARVLDADDPQEAGIEAAVTEARELLEIDGVAGVNLSGLASGAGERAGAEIKAEVGRRIRNLA